ncbi:endonuclease/exonuclease/phosphatase family protein [candidate division WOR-3 bacterium]|nr:endonuclease/exonuclease/phosphatase family protein [candidate division WOR-3 bacterium]
MPDPRNEHRIRHIAALILINLCLHAQSIRIATYNVLNFPEAMGMQRLDDLRTVIDYMNADILVVQEMQSPAGVTLFLDSIMNFYQDDYVAAPFHDGPDTDNALFYRRDKAELIRSIYLTTANRDIMEYSLLLLDAHEELMVYSVHFKASQGPENEAIRLQEATVLRNHLDSLDTRASFLVAGDFNIYTSSEPAYIMMTDSIANGQLFDPLRAPGGWHENHDFAYLHTQSSRVNQLPDNGSSGGLDDRFDMILCSSSLLDSAGLFIPAQTYTVFGNDGNHFNKAVNHGYNQSVPDHVADGLYFASDHLPISLDIVYGPASPQQNEIVKIYPNPMRNTAHLQLPWIEDFQRAEIAITNILGQRIFACTHYSPQSIVLQRDGMPIGVYFVHVRIHTMFRVLSYQTKLAVIE